MRAVICLAIFLAVVHTNFALRCFMCVGSRASDCRGNDVESKVYQNCSVSADKKVEWFEEHTGLKAPKSAKAQSEVCLKVDADDSELLSNFMQRSCGYTYDEIDLCEYIIATAPAVRNCELCTEELCNL